MTEIVWEDPPEAGHAGGGKRVWVDRLAPLRERPGVWANLGRYQSSTVTNIRQGLVAGIEEGEYEAVGRDHDKDAHTVTLFVRFVGKPNLKEVAS